MISDYQKEQLESLSAVNHMIGELASSQRKALMDKCKAYLRFRQEVDAFLFEYFSDICILSCYENQRSACCSREGIITFFADMAVNTLFSKTQEIDDILSVLKRDGKPGKCIYLSDEGCMWRIKPIICEMFLCSQAKAQVFGKDASLEDQWELLAEQRKRYTWPDRPVLFDDLENYFIDAGYVSPLMYLHNSPGLLRLKQKAKMM